MNYEPTQSHFQQGEEEKKLSLVYTRPKTIFKLCSKNEHITYMRNMPVP